MPTIRFRVKGTRNPSPVYLQYRDGRNNIWLKTGKTIDPSEWSHKTHKPLIFRRKELNSLNSKLEHLAKDIKDASNQTDPKEVDKTWLQKRIAIFNNDIVDENSSSDSLIDAVDYMLRTANLRHNSKGTLGLSKSRTNSYKNLRRLLLEYQGRRKFRVKDVDIKFGQDFLDWMLHKRKYAESYARKKIDDLKTVCADAEINGQSVSPQLKKIKGGKPRTKNIIYLSPLELKKIEKTTLESEALQNVRKWLLLGCNLGQRGQDLLNITENNFVTRHNLEVIELEQQKTGKQVTIPVLPVTKEILHEGLPYKISLQKFNNYLKLLCKEAGINEEVPGLKIEMIDKKGKIIPKEKNGKRREKGEKRKIKGVFPKWQLISSHVCRRSFATNIYGKLPTPLIMQITAHSTEKMLLSYIGKSSMDFAQVIADFYAKEAKKGVVDLN